MFSKKLIRHYYNKPKNGHPEITKTIKFIKRNYKFPNIKLTVKEYIKKYILY